MIQVQLTVHCLDQRPTAQPDQRSRILAVLRKSDRQKVLVHEMVHENRQF